MFSTPLICCSIGVTTVQATPSARAPGYWPETLMIGGAISGYCAIGKRENDTPPRITNTIETTAAKIGRAMKKCERRIYSKVPITEAGRPASTGFGLVRALGRGRRSAVPLHRDLLTGTHVHQA